MARQSLIQNESNTWKKKQTHQIGTMKIDLIDAHPAWYYIHNLYVKKTIWVSMID